MIAPNLVVTAAAVAALAAGAGALLPDRAGTASDVMRQTAPRAAMSPAPPSPARFVTGGAPTQGGWAKGQVPAGTRSLTLDGKPVAFARDGSFLVGFDRDAGSTATLSALMADGRTLSETVAISPRAWRIEHIATPLRPSGLGDEAFRERRAAELARIAAARALETGAEGWRQPFVWPAKGRLLGLFGAQRVYAGVPGSYHSGLDIAAGSGTVFVAPADGVVILAAEAPFTLVGRLLMLDHGSGLNSAFLHCSELLVHEGDRVVRGQPIGRVGTTGRATGPHLHWSVKWRDARLDPLLLAGPKPPD